MNEHPGEQMSRDEWRAFRRLAAAAAMTLGIAVAGGCASAGSGPNEGGLERSTVTVDGVMDVALWRDMSLSSDTVDRLPAVAWPALLRAYASLQVPLQGADPAKRIVATQHFRAHSRFAGAPLSQFVDCGSNITGDIANSYEITMRLGTRIDSTAAGSVLSSALSASATAVGSSAPPVHCSSRRTLERRLATMVANGS